MMMDMAVRLLTLVGAVFVTAHLIMVPAPALADDTAPPGLPDAAVQALGVMATSPKKVAGISSYQVRLWNGGTVYAVPGGDEAVVAILKSPDWNPALSVVFRSGPYIIFAKSVLDVPNAVLVPGKKDGLEAIDTDPIVCADSSIPGPRFC
jgi:hypothetical protein